MSCTIHALHLGVFLRASADVLLFAYLPLHLRADLAESRLWLISLVPTIPAFIRFAMAPAWGRLADRIGRQRPFLVMGLIAYGVLLALLPQMDRAVPIVFALGLFALPFSAFNPVSRAWLSLGEQGEAVFRLARWHQWEAAGFVASSAFVGWYVTEHPFAFASAMRGGAVLLAACALAVAWRLRDRPAGLNTAPRPTSPGRKGASTDRRSSGRRNASPREKTPYPDRAGHGERSSTVRARDSLVITFVPAAALFFLAVSSSAWESVATSFGLYFTESLAGSIQMYGLTLSGSTFVSLIAYGFLAGVARRHGAQPLFHAAAWGYTAMFLLIGRPSPWTAAFGYLLPLSTIVRTAFNLLIVRRVPASGRGQAMGVMEGVEACSGTVGALVGGILADRAGLPLIPHVALWSTVLLHLSAWRLRN